MVHITFKAKKKRKKKVGRPDWKWKKKRETSKKNHQNQHTHGHTTHIFPVQEGGNESRIPNMKPLVLDFF